MINDLNTLYALLVSASPEVIRGSLAIFATMILAFIWTAYDIRKR